MIPAAVHPVDTWHRLVETQDARALDALLAEDVVFHSPVVHAPQRGKALARLYLAAALQVFSNPGFRYVREIVGEQGVELARIRRQHEAMPGLQRGRHGLPVHLSPPGVATVRSCSPPGR